MFHAAFYQSLCDTFTISLTFTAARPAVTSFLILNRGMDLCCFPHSHLNLHASLRFTRVPCSLFPVPCSLLPVPCSLFPVPCSLFPVPCSLFPVLLSSLFPASLFPVPCSLFPVPCSLFPVPCSLFPVPCSLLPAPCSLFPVPSPEDTHRTSVFLEFSSENRLGYAVVYFLDKNVSPTVSVNLSPSVECSNTTLPLGVYLKVIVRNL